MRVLHGIWVGAALHVWAEDSVLPAHGTGTHPFACQATEIADLLEPLGDLTRKAVDVELTLRLPTAAGSPVASTMRRRLAARSRRNPVEVSRPARAARLALASGLVPAASSRSSRAAWPRARTWCQGQSRFRISWPRPSSSRTCIVPPRFVA